MTPKLKVIKAKISKWDYIKLKIFFTAKETINKMKRQHSEWKKLSIQTYEEFIQLNS